MHEQTHTASPGHAAYLDARFMSAFPARRRAGGSVRRRGPALPAGERESFLSDLAFLFRFAFGMPSAYADVPRD